MDKNPKIVEFIRREVLWFFIGTQVALLAVFRFGWGDWLGAQHDWTTVFLLVCFGLMAFFSWRAKRRQKA